MNKHVFFFLIIICQSIGFSQNTQDIKTEQDSIIKEKQERNKKEDALARSLSFLSTGNSFSSLGNFAAISTDEKTIKGSIFLLNRDYNMYTFTVEAGASDGVGTLFDEGSQGANVSLGIEHRFILKNKKGYVSPGQTALDKLEGEREQLNYVYNDSILALFNRVNSLNKSGVKVTINDDKTTSTIVEGTEVKKILPTEYNTIQKIDRALKKFQDLGTDTLQMARLNKMKKQLEEYKNQLLNRTKNSVELIVEEKILALGENQKKKLKEVDEKEFKLKAKLLDLEFFAIGAKATNKSFKFFDETLALDKQIKTRDYTSKEVNLSYTSVRNIQNIKRNNRGYVTDFDPGKLRHFSIGSQLRITDNQDDLDDIEIQDTRFNDETNQRIVVGKRKAKSGGYKKDLKAMTFVVDYYQFFKHNSNSVALHINPRYLIKESSKPVTQIQIGLLFPFKKKDDEKTTVNIEIFYQFKDVFDKLDKFDNGFFKRNIVGIQTSFPFNFNF